MFIYRLHNLYSQDVKLDEKKFYFYKPTTPLTTNDVNTHQTKKLYYLKCIGNRVSVIDSKKNEVLQILTGHTDSVYDAVCSSNGLIITASADRTIRVWNLQANRYIQVLHGHFSAIHKLSITRDNERVMSLSSDGVIKIWDIKRGICQLTIANKTSKIKTAHFNTDEKCIITTSDDEKIRIWDTNTGKQIYQTITVSNTRLMKWSSGNCFLLDATFSTDEKMIISLSCNSWLRIFDKENGKLLHTKSLPRSPQSFIVNGGEITIRFKDRSIEKYAYTDFMHKESKLDITENNTRNTPRLTSH